MPYASIFLFVLSRVRRLNGTEGLNMFSLCFFYFLIVIFNFSEIEQRTKIREKDDPYVEGIEVKFQRDLLRGFWERDVYNVDNGYGTTGMGRAAIGVYFHSLDGVASRTYCAGRPHVERGPKFLVLI